MNFTVLDFETYFDNNYSLKKLTIPEYVFDPRFHVHGLAIRSPDGCTTFRADVERALEELPQRFGKQLERTTVVCHHAHFDFYILNHLYGLRPRNFLDTLLLANHVHGPRQISGQKVSLRALAQRYGIGIKGDLEFMSGVRYPSALQLADLTAYAEHDANLTWQLVVLLLPKITRPEIEIPIAMHAVRLFTERGINIDIPGIDNLEHQVCKQVEQYLDQAGVTREEVSKDKKFTELLESALASTGRTIPMKTGKQGPIPATARKDPEMQALEVDDNPAVAALVRGRLEKKSEDQKLSRLDTLRRVATATRGILPPYLVYFGCHTGRFSGGGGFNLQNLAKNGLGGRIRNLLVARPGHTFVIADLAQIEARITAWFADESTLLDAFTAGRDIYSEFAGRTFGQTVRKPREDDPREMRERLTALREVGKQAVLGLGYQMGALEFMKQLRAKPVVARLFETGQLTPVACKQIVQSFRETYASITCLWRWLDDAARNAVDGVQSTTQKLNFLRDGHVMKVWLPSGRSLRYENLRLEAARRSIRFLGDDGMEHEFTPEDASVAYGRESHLYGGKLCENIVQATARDLLVEAILRLENSDLRVMFHVHDEVVVEVAEADADAASQAIDAELSRQPPWADGLPVKCEVQVANRYTK